MLDELEWPSLENHRVMLSLIYKINSGAVSLDKYKYLIPAPNLKGYTNMVQSPFQRLSKNSMFLFSLGVQRYTF